jgi:hypothetical protein
MIEPETMVCPVCRNTRAKCEAVDENLERIKKIWDEAKVREIAEALVRRSGPHKGTILTYWPTDAAEIEAALWNLIGGKP